MTALTAPAGGDEPLRRRQTGDWWAEADHRLIGGWWADAVPTLVGPLDPPLTLQIPQRPANQPVHLRSAVN